MVFDKTIIQQGKDIQPKVLRNSIVFAKFAEEW